MGGVDADGSRDNRVARGGDSWSGSGRQQRSQQCENGGCRQAFHEESLHSGALPTTPERNESWALSHQAMSVQVARIPTDRCVVTAVAPPSAAAAVV